MRVRDAAVGLYEPLDVPKPFGESLWIVDGPACRLSLSGLSVPFPTRMTVARLDDGGLWLHSPIAPTPGLQDLLAQLGTVRHLVSPNKLHYASIGAWSRLYPQATCWASPGVRERAAAHGIDLRFDATLADKPPPQWRGQIAQLVFEGNPWFREVVFFHVRSRTLVLADLIENFEARRTHGALRTLLRLAGNLDPDGKAPLDMRLGFLGHRDRARGCLRRMLDWAPERIVLAHGRCYAGNGARELARAFRWLD